MRIVGPRSRLGNRLAVVVALTVVVGGLAAASPAQARVKVFFVRGEQLTSVNRPGVTVHDAVRALLAGPSRGERRREVRSYLPKAIRRYSVATSGDLVVVNLPARSFRGVAGTPVASARFAQVLRTVVGRRATVRSPRTIRRLQLLVDGRPAPGLVPGIDTAVPVSLDQLAAPAPVTTTPARPQPGVPHAWIVKLQARLAELGYLDAADIDGFEGPATKAAIIAFQKWEGLGVDALAGAQTVARLATAVRPTPRTADAVERRVEVLLDRQLVLAIERNRVVRVLHASSGAAATPTPSGQFAVYARTPLWWSVPFGQWLPWSVRFDGGIAFHEFADVPTVPASHGCVRLIAANARWLFSFTSVGTPVRVLATSV